MAEQKEKLFSEFEPVSTEAWIAKITTDLKGVPFEKKLVWKTGEGFNANPFYRLEDLEGLKTTTSLPGEFPYVRGTKTNNNWYVRQDIVVDDCKAANAKALDVLNKGVTSLGFTIKGDDVTAENIATLLDGICPACVELNFSTCLCKAEALLAILVENYKNRGVDLEKCVGSVNYDPFKKPLIKGHKNEDWTEKAIAVLKAGEALPNYRVLCVNAYWLNNAGAYIAQELGYALAWGNDLIAKLYEEYQLTRREAAAMGIEIEDYGASNKRLTELKGQIRALGSVNVAAIEEYKEVSERYEFLSGQIADVEKSREELHRLIGELTEKMAQQFRDRFARINRAFGETFSELFGGGSAQLLLSDEHDILECDIEIKVQPPGKNLKSIEPLSGGEKGLSAISLLFAILKVTPAPFCIFDEVEAALDDVNVTRYAQYVRRMTKNTQFILITHRRGTMEEADVLYGVTMQESGVSKLLELKTAEMAKQLGLA